ncbi:GAF domain-containing sensor histidine kinase [Algoriphagus litoralis]|uniref:GAF domain-containing sensor histidine kinase n=1 Tax=Algoriphagus litoralis TaxID=2202829 RepID=UPI000DB94EF5|nr:GAF domain-containing sensor histidine kinase [Algoriphagus litoralis]
MSKPTITELQRLLALSSLGVDYFEPNRGLDNLVILAAKISGSEVSMINLLDAHTQWTIASQGIEGGQMPLEESVCQFTIQQEVDQYFEVEDLSQDDRFKDRNYVTENLKLRYYLGVPLTTREGYAIGSLCVLDPKTIKLTESQKDLLSHVAKQIVDRLKINQFIIELNEKLIHKQKTTNKIAHDVRGPISGIVGLAEIIAEDEQNPAETREIMGLMINGGNGVMDMVSSLLREEFNQKGELEKSMVEFTLGQLQERLIQLYIPQAVIKEISLQIKLNSSPDFSVSKNLVLQILGNLISNAIKFTPRKGLIQVEISVEEREEKWIFIGKVKDNGVGMTQEKIAEILSFNNSSEEGSEGEEGFGLGLRLVQNLVHQLDGQFHIQSVPGKGSDFKVEFQVN